MVASKHDAALGVVQLEWSINIIWLTFNEYSKIRTSREKIPRST